MPELPEVETIARGLARRFVGRRILRCRHLSPHLLEGRGRSVLRALRGRRILDIRRRGKHLIFVVDGGYVMVFHLKMTGQFLASAAEDTRDRHTHLVLSFDRGRELRFRDTRKFGRLRLARKDAQAALPKGLGPEPLEVGRNRFLELLGRRRGRLKSLLLNQGFVAGIGNIYADEILFEARLSPVRPASGLEPSEAQRLWSGMRRILSRAVTCGGSSIRDYTDADGRPGRFQFEHKVYGRAGRPCPRCGVPIRRLVIGGRSTHFCPFCQKEKSAGRRFLRARSLRIQPLAKAGV
ncbi:MAG: bifunctional DNA-formamidopyrimidine glycosylase/DNA-(apurinic or apyrimidinic site) lyase [Candidatus Aminicenantes bacterium]|nr:bifunctional DNA-formamidopyrimidine glycosylase/DNA-(apurinic or apyrimidinic site) lyase [Candidatus Aminicenantes bacterium]